MHRASLSTVSLDEYALQCTFMIHLSSSSIHFLLDNYGICTPSLTHSHNSLPSLQPAVTALTNLKQLKLDHNALPNLPDNLGQLLHVEELDLSHNKLTTLPSSIGEMRSLKILSASHNQLTSLPESLGKLRGKSQTGVCVPSTFEFVLDSFCRAKDTDIKQQQNVRVSTM